MRRTTYLDSIDQDLQSRWKGFDVDGFSNISNFYGFSYIQWNFAKELVNMSNEIKNNYQMIRAIKLTKVLFGNKDKLLQQLLL